MHQHPEFAEHDGETPIDRLHAYVENSDFDGISFDILDHSRPDVLTSEAELGEDILRIWRGPKTPKATKIGTWYSVNGVTHPIDPAELGPAPHGGPFSREEDEDVREGLMLLLLIHATVEPFFQAELMDARSKILNAFDGVAEHALDLRDDSEQDFDREDWERTLDAFTQQCRSGMFAGVSVDESPDVPGALNISAAVMDHVTHQPVKLKVFFRPSAAGHDEPDHWMAVGEIEALAHGVEDEQRAELLAGFPQESREFLLHAVDHLHGMAHEAAEVVNARSEVPYLFAQESGMPHNDEVEDALTTMASHAESDALAALNGVARLYTGTLPPSL